MEIRPITLYNSLYPRQALVSVLMMVLLYLFSNYILSELNRAQGMMGEIAFRCNYSLWSAQKQVKKHFDLPSLPDFWEHALVLALKYEPAAKGATWQSSQGSVLFLTCTHDHYTTEEDWFLQPIMLKHAKLVIELRCCYVEHCAYVVQAFQQC